jgi:hypothetical protein
MYDPVAINTLINAAPAPIFTWSDAPPITQCLYDHYKYQLFVLEFISVMNKQLNVPMRASILAAIKKYIKMPTKLFHDLKTILADWSGDYEHIIGIFTKFAGAFSCESSEYNRLVGNKKTTYDADTIARIIDQSRFSFDDTAMTTLEAMDSAALRTRLSEILVPIINVSQGDVKIDSFPATITSCSAVASRHDYCDKTGRLKISASDFAIFAEQLARDIKNPLKQRRLMMIITTRATNEFSFINHSDEHIYITAE